MWSQIMNGRVSSIRFSAYGQSDVGNVCEPNADAFTISEQLGLFIVSDGIGERKAGALISAMMIQALHLQIRAERLARKIESSLSSAAVSEGLVRAIGFVNDMLLDKTKGIPELKGVGATVVVAYYAEDGLMALAHLGNSRAYLLRHGYFERLTSDHISDKILCQTEQTGNQQKEKYPSGHTLTRHVGKEECVSADVASLPLEAGDRILLCTEGLTSMIKDREIGTILWETENRKSACQLLIARAKKEGGIDNITVLIVDVEDIRQRRRRKRIIVRRKIGRSFLILDKNQNSKEDLFSSF